MSNPQRVKTGAGVLAQRVLIPGTEAESALQDALVSNTFNLVEYVGIFTWYTYLNGVVERMMGGDFFF